MKPNVPCSWNFVFALVICNPNLHINGHPRIEFICGTSVSPSVSPSVPLTSKFGFKLVFYEVNVPCSWNFVYSILIIWMLQISSLIRSLSLCSSVRSSVCLSVQITSKFGFKLVFYEVNVPCSWNFVYSILIIWMLQISSLIRSLSLCSSVRSSVCLSVQITSKFGFKLVFYEVNVLCI